MERLAALLGEEDFEEHEGFAGWDGGDDAGAGGEGIGWVGGHSISRCVAMGCRIKILECEFGGDTDFDVAEVLEAQSDGSIFGRIQATQDGMRKTKRMAAE